MSIRFLVHEGWGITMSTKDVDCTPTENRVAAVREKTQKYARASSGAPPPMPACSRVIDVFRSLRIFLACARLRLLDLSVTLSFSLTRVSDLYFSCVA